MNKEVRIIRCNKMEMQLKSRDIQMLSVILINYLCHPVMFYANKFMPINNGAVIFDVNIIDLKQ